MATFSAARGQYLAAGVGRVTRTKAEFTSAAKFGRSICWFHKKVPVLGKAGEKNPCPRACQGIITEISTPLTQIIRKI